MRVTVMGPQGHQQEIETIIATGCTGFVLSSSLGSNDAMLRGILSFKISRFVKGNPAYAVEVAICSGQLREPLRTHKGNDSGR